MLETPAKKQRLLCDGKATPPITPTTALCDGTLALVAPATSSGSSVSSGDAMPAAVLANPEGDEQILQALEQAFIPKSEAK